MLATLAVAVLSRGLEVTGKALAATSYLSIAAIHMKHMNELSSAGPKRI